VEHRLGDPIKEQSDSHSRGKQHGKPASRGEIRFRVVSSQTDRPILAEHEKDDEQQNDIYRKGKKPSGIGGNPVEQRIEDTTDHIVKYNGKQDKSNDYRCRSEKHYRMYVKSLFLLFDILVDKPLPGYLK
jgi:hypothetical protein